jgi:uncharacterized membrane protein
MAASKASGKRRTAPVRSHPTAPSNGTAARSSTATVRKTSAADKRPVAAAAAVEADGAPVAYQWTTFVLALIGLGVSIYVTYEHFFQKVFQGCSSTGLVDCQKVTTSAQSYVPIMSSGILHLPVAVLGLGFYLFAGVPLMSPWAWQSGRRLIQQARLATIGVLLHPRHRAVSRPDRQA